MTMGKEMISDAPVKTVTVINGPNLNLLGVREPEVYGENTLEDLRCHLDRYACGRGVQLRFFQENNEGALIDCIHKASETSDGIIINPAAFAHYSYALRDALSSVPLPAVEVHLSDIDAREAFRRISVTAPACVALVRGLGFQGYCEALDLLLSGRTTRLAHGRVSLRADGKITVAPGHEQVRCDERADEARFGLSTDECVQARRKRLACLRAAMARAGFDAFCVFNTENIHWITAIEGVFDSESAHCLLILPDRAVLHTDSRYAGALRRALSQDETGLLELSEGAKTHACFVSDMLREGMPSEAALRLGIEDDISLARFRALEKSLAEMEAARVEETHDFIGGLRAVKDECELARLKEAQRITDAAFQHIIAYMQPGMTERQVQRELDRFMVEQGSQGLAFATIMATGPNGANPHAVPGDTLLQRGQCMVIDFGARRFGYCADMTRTVFLGTPATRLVRSYEVLREANEAVEAALAPGVTGRQMQELAESVLARGGFEGKMGHGLGHGVGLEVHEQPYLNRRNNVPLEPGNVVTVEPGIYLEGDFGMRLEDFGVIRPDGFEVFTQSSHKMVIIEQFD